MKKILVAVENYPNNDGGVVLMYVHTRNKYYQENGYNVTVLNFSCKRPYEIDGIKVIGLADYRANDTKYDLLILHAANIRHHYVFLKKYGDRFKKFIFFYHGHEVLMINKVYPKPYNYMKEKVFKSIFQNIYDSFKLFVWRHYLKKHREKSAFVFVSKWMKDEFKKWTRLDDDFLSGHSYITYNCVDKEFEQGEYCAQGQKKYDFITIRSFLDGSKYCIDLVNKWAENNPDLKFLVIGKGKYFEHYSKAVNIEWENKNLNHQQIKQRLDQAKYALMPTRTDAQGLMMCEMAAYGIPVITSDIPVCHEVFDGFNNAFFVNNEEDVDLHRFIDSSRTSIKDNRYYLNNTITRELELIQTLT